MASTTTAREIRATTAVDILPCPRGEDHESLLRELVTERLEHNARHPQKPWPMRGAVVKCLMCMAELPMELDTRVQ
jgi:hypothetical protein